MQIIVKVPPVLFRKALTLYSLFAGPTLRDLEREVSEICPALGKYLEWWKGVRYHQDEFYECLLGRRRCKRVSGGIKVLEKLEFKPRAPRKLVSKIREAARSLEREELINKIFLESRFEVLAWESPQNRTVEPFLERRFCMLWSDLDPLSIKSGLVHGMLVTELETKIEDPRAVEALSDLIEIKLSKKLRWIDDQAAKKWWDEIQSSEEAREYLDWISWAEEKVKGYNFTPIGEWASRLK